MNGLRARRSLFALLICVSVALVPAVAAGAAPPIDKLLHSGDAYGTFAFVGDLVTAGKTARLGLNCESESGIHRENTTAGIELPPLVTSGTVHTTIDTAFDGVIKSTSTTAETEGLALLDAEPGVLPPVISASVVRAVSTTSYDGSTFTTSDAGSEFIGLVVAGVPIPTPTPEPDTEIPLPGIGRVVLNEQVESIRPQAASLSVNMIHVYIDSFPGIPAGSEIIVSHAKSGLRRGPDALLGGRAYISTVQVADVIESGPTALVTVGCLGGDKTNNIAGVNVPPLLTLGEGVTTAQGTTSGGTASVRTSATVQSVDLLEGTVTVDAVTAVANGERDLAVKTFSDEGSAFLNLFVGEEQVIDPPPNTSIEIPGVGTLWLHRVIERQNFIEVRMIELILLEGDVTIRVAVAKASIT
ncbi:MAG: choice-of-anchor P family protein [Acidimicrobiales bacterium]